jgi:hypothetical protein
MPARRLPLLAPIVLLARAVLCAPAVAAEPAPPLRPTRTEAPPLLDGRLDERAWQSALLVDDFVQRAPREGAPASERTEVRILYTKTDLYLGVRAFDRAAPRTRATVLRRDDFELTENDQFVVAIDSEGSGRAGYWFSTNPLGVRVDAQFFDEGAVWQGEWNGVWDCATRVDDAGWSAELRIPFSTLRLRPAERNVMGLNLFRRLVRTNEQLFAPLIPLQYANGTPNVSAARKYAFEGLAPRRDLRLRPYVLGRSAWVESAAGTQASEADAGIDLSLGLTPSLVGTLTLNPDFALADVDDRQLNLTRFSLFYPEKREFFLEQGGLFAFGVPREVELFFSRRVGLADAGSGAAVRQLPFGAKLTGRVGPLDLGLLQVRTSAIAAQPAQDVSVARLRYGFGRSSLGLLGTRLAEADARYPSIGVDGIIYVRGETAVSGFAAAADDPKQAGWRGAWNLAVSRGGERQSFRLALTDVAGGFDPPLAFVQRPDSRRWDAQGQWPVYFDSGRARRVVPGYAARRVEGPAGVEGWSHSLSFGLDLQSEDSLSVYGGPALDVVPEPFPVFPGVEVAPGSYEAGLVGARAATKPGRALAAEAKFEAGQLYGGTSRSLSSRLAWKPSRHLSATGQLSTAWVRLPQGSFRADVVQARLDAALDTRWSARALGQWDNASRDLGIDLRLNCLLREGRQIALVYGRREERPADGRAPIPRARPAGALLLKLTWLFLP